MNDHSKSNAFYTCVLLDDPIGASEGKKENELEDLLENHIDHNNLEDIENIDFA